MAIQLDTATRNAILDVIESTNGTSCALEIRTGAAPGVAVAPTGTILATINLPTDWMAAASGGTKALAGTWSDVSADNSGTAAHFAIYSSQATKNETTCFMQGTVDQGTGDLSLDNKVLVAGQTVTITAFTLTGPNA